MYTVLLYQYTKLYFNKNTNFDDVADSTYFILMYFPYILNSKTILFEQFKNFSGRRRSKSFLFYQTGSPKYLPIL